MYISNNMSHEVIYSGNCNFECVIVSIQFGHCKFCVCLLYRPPNSSNDFLDYLYDVLCTLDISLFSNFLLLGDFNIDFLSQSHPHFSKLVCITSSFLLHQVVSHPTHFSHSGVPSIIDLCFVSHPSNLISCDTIAPLSTSDHMGIHLTYKLPGTSKKLNNPQRSVWCYSLGDFDKACEILLDIDWDTITNESDIDLCWRNWQKTYLSIISQCVPQKVLPRKKHLPWISLPILKTIKKRNSLLKKYKCTGNQVTLSQYKFTRNRVISELRKAKHAFFKQLHSSDAKTFGSYTNF